MKGLASHMTKLVANLSFFVGMGGGGDMSFFGHLFFWQTNLFSFGHIVSHKFAYPYLCDVSAIFLFSRTYLGISA
jgi:hypothetical protein